MSTPQDDEWMKEALHLLDRFEYAALGAMTPYGSMSNAQTAKSALTAHLAARPLPQATLSEELPPLPEARIVSYQREEALRVAGAAGVLPDTDVVGTPGLVIPPAPPECETEDEKTAFAFGYWQGLHAARTDGVAIPQTPKEDGHGG